MSERSFAQMRVVTAFVLAICALPTARAGDVRLLTDEAESVLKIVSLERKGAAVPDEAWARLFSSEGYRRLKAREFGIKRPFKDEDFRSFVKSKELIGRYAILRKTLDEWKRADMSECRKRALAYLPKGADISAKIYVLIKPRTNSFVWQVDTDPAIMLYLDPEESRGRFRWNRLPRNASHRVWAELSVEGV